jgi:RNA polymerase sigma-70 factor (ECF subfamily)
VSFNKLDEEILLCCLENQPHGWEYFVDRFMGLVMHVIDYSATIRGLEIESRERDRLCENVFATFYHDSFRLLREFDGRGTLTTYLTILVRRIVVRILLNRESSSLTTK